LIYPENIDEFISIDETSLSNGELYTYVTNKSAKGKKGTLIASIKGTKSSDISNVLNKIPLEKRQLVKEVTLDMANNMEAAVRLSFPNASLVTDHFHVIKLVMDALQHVRIKHRWEELDKENEAIKRAKTNKERYIPFTFENEDTPKQLLARSRYIIAKREEKWTKNQKQRADILFKNYPIIEKAYYHIIEFRNVYQVKNKEQANEKFIEWLIKTEELNIEQFTTASNTISNKLDTILNYFINRSTNANAESFNAKIKLFRANLRGVIDIKFFLFRLEKLFA
jgi:transposase